jgi:hypothetical protein
MVDEITTVVDTPDERVALKVLPEVDDQALAPLMVLETNALNELVTVKVQPVVYTVSGIE